VQWSSTLVGRRLTALTQESDTRFRLVFAADAGELSVVASLGASSPWIAAGVRSWTGPLWSAAQWVQPAVHALRGRRLAGVVKPPADRSLRFDFGDGWGLAFELTPQRANLIVLGEKLAIVAAFHPGKSARARLTPGLPWAPPELPAGRLNPFEATPEEIDAALAAAPGAAIDRVLLGIGPIGASLVAEEREKTGRSAGTVLRERLDALLHGSSEPVIERSGDGSERLLPWRPATARPGHELTARESPEVTAAIHYESRDAEARGAARIEALGAILRGEMNRARSSEQKVRTQLASFVDSDRHRLMGEALLAGLAAARRSGEFVRVPDPYDASGGELVIPAPPGRPLTQVANELFAKHRRALRGRETAASRADTLARRVQRLAVLLVVHERVTGEDEALALEAEMRREGLPVGLDGPTRAKRAAARLSPPRLAGVRIVTSQDGWTILVGRTSRDNDRLTFKIAAPEDFWLHAAGVPGAHVVIRNPERLGTVPQGTLAEAARLALWFSDGRSQQVGDVHWTRRKLVRRAKGGAPGLAVLKRFETIRVRAERPPDGD